MPPDVRGAPASPGRLSVTVVRFSRFQMPLTALGLVLGAALFHSAWNFILKSAPRRLEASLLALGAAVLLSAPVLPFHPVSELSGEAWALARPSGGLEPACLVAV